VLIPSAPQELVSIIDSRVLAAARAEVWRAGVKESWLLLGMAQKHQDQIVMHMP
jgi:hypothetical protein